MKNNLIKSNLIIGNIESLNKLDVLFKNFVIILFGSLMLALSARIKIDIPPVPVTLQTLVLLVFAMSVGWRLSVLTFLTYLFEGSIGLPFFANPPFSGFPYRADAEHHHHYKENVLPIFVAPVQKWMLEMQPRHYRGMFVHC